MKTSTAIGAGRAIMRITVPEMRQRLYPIRGGMNEYVTVPKSEEKREARQAEQERLEELQRIEEEERKRRARGERPSLRARLAAKKAIVAANSAVPQRETQRQVQNEPIKPHIEL